MAPAALRSFLAALLLVPGLTAAGCQDDPCQEYIAPIDSEGAPPNPDSAYDFAVLEVHEPASASIHPLGEPLHLLAQAWGPEGQALEVDEVTWLTDLYEPIGVDQLEGDVELPAGIYDITAVARLPNGDKLRTTVGGVRVQARWTGVYTGTLALVVQMQAPGIGALALRCDGPLDFVVSVDGLDAPVEDGACTINVLGQSFDATYAVEIVVYPAGLLRGTVSLAFATPFGSFEVPVEWAGAFYDDRFSAGIEDTVNVPIVGSADVTGSLQARLINPYVDPEDG